MSKISDEEQEFESLVARAFEFVDDFRQKNPGESQEEGFSHFVLREIANLRVKVRDLRKPKIRSLNS